MGFVSAGSSDSEPGREASQADAAQGFESAQEEFAPSQPPQAAASTKGRGSGQGGGRGKGRGRGGATSGRPAASKAAPTDDAQGTAHTAACLLLLLRKMSLVPHLWCWSGNHWHGRSCLIQLSIYIVVLEPWQDSILCTCIAFECECVMAKSLQASC